MLFSFIFYFILLFTCIATAYIADKYNSKKILYLLISIFAFVTGFRGDEVGIDTPHYVDLWNEALSGNLLFIEVGFQWLIYVLQRFTKNPTIFLFVCSTIIYLFIIIRLWDFRKIASFPIMIAGLCMFTLMPSMNIMRQYCAISIVFFSTRYILGEKHYLKFIIGVFIATLLHTSALSAISFLGFELISWHNFSKLKKACVIAILILLPLIGLEIYNLAYSEYGEYFENEEQSLGSLTLLKFVFIIFSFYCSKLWKKAIDSNVINNYVYVSEFIFGAFILGVSLESLAYFFPFMGRIGLPFSIFGIVYWGMLFKLTKNLFLKKCYFIAFLFLLAMPFTLSILFNGYGTVPYLFCWQ